MGTSLTYTTTKPQGWLIPNLQQIEEEHFNNLLLELERGAITEQVLIKLCHGYKYIDNFMILKSLKEIRQCDSKQ